MVTLLIPLFPPFKKRPPSSPAAALHQAVVIATAEIVDYCAVLGLALHLETGEATGAAVDSFIDEVLAAAQQPGAQFYANFDPANFILCMLCPAIMLCEASASPWPCVLRQTAWRSR